MKYHPKDPKHLGVPNINFSLTENKDPREKQYVKQRVERGFDSSELWSLDYTIARFIIPRLEAFKEEASEVVVIDDIPIDEMLEALRLIVKDGEGEVISVKDEETITEGLIMLAKHLRALWY